MKPGNIYWNETAVILVVLAIMFLTPMTVLGDDDITNHPQCPICGMDRAKFAHSRMLIHYEDGSRFGACSLHCAALELAYRPGKIPVKIEVGDYDTRQLLDAEKAVWVMGGDKMGVMTAQAKWAFGSRSAAQRFIDAHGGDIVDFDTAMTAAYTDMHKDTRMIRQKRQRKKAHLK